MRLPFLPILLFLALLLLAACAGEEEDLFLQDPEAALLQESEMPGRFSEVEGSRRHISNEESCAGTEGAELEECLSRLEQWGRLDGIEVEFWADDPSAFDTGVYDVFNSTSIYRDPKGAEEAFRDGLERLEKGLAEMTDATQVEIEGVGDQSAAFGTTTIQKEGDSEISVTLHVVDFRRGNTLARVGAIAPSALASVDDALALAKRVDERILRVAGQTAPTVSPTAVSTGTPTTTATPTTGPTETATASATADATAPP
jgi:hypothetical protein